MSGLADVAGARDGQLERVDVESALVGVGEQPDKVVLLEALRVVLVVHVGAGSAGVPGNKIKKMKKEFFRFREKILQCFKVKFSFLTYY